VLLALLQPGSALVVSLLIGDSVQHILKSDSRIVKTLRYQLPALLQPAFALVVSPLIGAQSCCCLDIGRCEVVLIEGSAHNRGAHLEDRAAGGLHVLSAEQLSRFQAESVPYQMAIPSASCAAAERRDI